MFILVDNTTQQITGASIQELTGDDSTTAYEITDGTTIDDIIDADMKFTFKYDGSSLTAMTASELHPDITGEDAFTMLRTVRDEKLVKEVDPYVCNPLRWQSLTPESQQAIMDYRQALLDMTTTYPTASYAWNTTSNKYEEQFVWPTGPTIVAL